MGNDSICVGFLINSKARARNGEHLCTHLCSSGAEMLRLLTDKRSRAHPLSTLTRKGLTPRSEISSGTWPVHREPGLCCLAPLPESQVGGPDRPAPPRSNSCPSSAPQVREAGGRGLVTPARPRISTPAVATSNLQTTPASSLGPLLALFPIKSLYTCPLNSPLLKTLHLLPTVLTIKSGHCARAHEVLHTLASG